MRRCLPTKSAQVFSTLLVSSGLRFCEAIGLQPADFAFEAGILEVTRSVVKGSLPAAAHAAVSWLIDAGENPKAVMHRLGQADLRATARYVYVLDETGESAAKRFEGLLPPL